MTTPPGASLRAELMERLRRCEECHIGHQVEGARRLMCAACVAQAVQAAYEDAAVIAETICQHKGDWCSFGRAPKVIAAALRARPAEPAGEKG